MNQANDSKFPIVFKLNDAYLKARDSKDNFLLKDFYAFPLEKEDRLKCLSQLDNPYLLKINTYKTRDQIFLVEEPVTSRDLIDRCTSLADSEFFEEQIRLWLYQILTAVDHMHQIGVLHKRISKGWIGFVGDELKVIVNKNYSFLKERSTSSKLRVNRDECNFNAPEFTNLGSCITHKYDLWSVGWLLYHMCTLENPFDSLNFMSEFKSDIKTSLRMHLPKKFSRELNEIFLRLTEVSPVNRSDAHIILEENIFYRFRYYLEKVIFETHYTRRNSNDIGRFSFTITDERDRGRKKLLRRYFKSNKNLDSIVLKKNRITCASLNMFEDFFNDEIFKYTIEPVFHKSLNSVLEQMKANKLNVSTSQIIHWFAGLIDAISTLHKNKIIHKYVCPGLIGFNDKDQIKLTIHERSQEVNDINDLIKVNKYACAFNSPEICLFGKINSKYDIWCLGWTLYRMCSLQDPYFELKELENFEAFKPMNLLKTRFSADVDLIFQKMVEIMFNNRPSATKLAEYLQASSDSISVEMEVEDQAQFPGSQTNSFSTNETTKENLINERYRKIFVLKDDFFGITYIVEDLKAKNNKMELKMFKSTYGIMESKEIEKFLFNFKLPNLPVSIMKYTDHFKVSNLLYTVSEHFEADSLEKRLENPTSFEVKLLWLSNLIRAIAYLHRIQIIHRDIRPANIRIDKHDNLKLCDFAFSFFFQKDNQVKFPTNVLCYMSPELVKLTRHDSKTDIWSFGCVMFEMFTGDKAFDDKNQKNLATKINLVQYTKTPIKNSTLNNLIPKIFIASPSNRCDAKDIIKELESACS